MVSIIIHILPQEIDQLEQTLIGLKKCSVHTNKDYLVEVVMNTNLTRWEKCTFPKKFFTNKLSELDKLTKSWAKTKFWVSENEEIMGVVDPRRNCTQHNSEAILWLDVDIVFSDTILGHLEAAIDNMDNDYYVITPETTRLWDNTWDVITNEDAFNEEANHDNYFNRDPYTSAGLQGEVHLKPINTFKWGGGWFTCLSGKLLNKLPIPKSLGSYGLEDTFVMFCCIELKKLGLLNPIQYIMVNEVIIENNLYRYNPYNDYLHTINKKDEFRQIAHSNFKSCIEDTIKSFKTNEDNL